MRPNSLQKRQKDLKSNKKKLGTVLLIKTPPHPPPPPPHTHKDKRYNYKMFATLSTSVREIYYNPQALAYRQTNKPWTM